MKTINIIIENLDLVLAVICGVMIIGACLAN